MTILQCTQLAILIAGLCSIGQAEAQIIDSDDATLLEEMAEQTDLSENFSDEILESLEQIRNQPIRLQRATPASLATIPFLDPIRAEHLLLYIQQYGAPVNIAELATVEGFSEELANRLAPYLSFCRNQSPNWRESAKEYTWQARSSLRLTLPYERGYRSKSESRFSGGPIRHRARGELRFPEKARLGLAVEKDAGEPLWKNGTFYGYDYLSGYLLLERPLEKIVPQLSQLIIGDFKIRTGYGLINGQGFGFYKAGFVAEGAKPGRGISPHTGYNESDFQRGIALRLDQGRWNGEAYGMIKRADAIVEKDSVSNGKGVIRSLPAEGLHRTETERMRRENVSLGGIGARAGYSGRIVAFELQYATLRYSLPVVSKTNWFAAGTVRGALHENYGVCFRLKLAKAQIYGEWARYNNKGDALLAGLQAKAAAAGISVELSCRFYDRFYAAPLGRGFGQANKNANEEGYFVHLSKTLTRKTILSGYADIYSSNHAKYRANGPTQGYSMGVRLEHKEKVGGHLRIEYRQKMKEVNATLPNATIMRPEPEIVQSLKFTGLWPVGPRFSIKGETKGARQTQIGNRVKGALLFAALRWSGEKPEMKAELWLSRVASDKGMEPFYLIQRSAGYNSVSTACSGRGSQAGIWFEWRPCRVIQIDLKASHWFYDTVRTTGSGASRWEGSGKTDLEISVRLGNSS